MGLYHRLNDNKFIIGSSFAGTDLLCWSMTGLMAILTSYTRVESHAHTTDWVIGLSSDLPGASRSMAININITKHSQTILFDNGCKKRSELRVNGLTKYSMCESNAFFRQVSQKKSCWHFMWFSYIIACKSHSMCVCVTLITFLFVITCNLLGVSLSDGGVTYKCSSLLW